MLEGTRPAAAAPSPRASLLDECRTKLGSGILAMRYAIQLVILVFVGWHSAAGLAQQTIYVDGSAGDDTWNGLCEEWDGGTCGPKATIQAGIDASQPGDEVVIADGRYVGVGNKDLDFGGRAIVVRSAGGVATRCVIDCEHAGRACHFHSGEDGGAVLRDLTIRSAGTDAGSVYCQGASPTLINCTIMDGLATDGAGIYCDEHASPTLMGCTIAGNTAGRGGGVGCAQNSNPTLTKCIIRDNVGSYGGGVVCAQGSSPTLTNCIIRDNVAAYGAGLWCIENSCPTLMNCTISGNRYSDFGAGLECDSSDPLLINCVISDNRADYGGGGVNCRNASPTLINCTIANNVGGWNGGGVCSRYGSSPTLTRCTIIGNTSHGCGGGVFCDDASATLTSCLIGDNGAAYGGGLDCLSNANPRLTNCVVTGNTAAQRGGGVRCCESTPTLTNCMISGNTAAEQGGAVCCELTAHPVLTNCTIVGNSALSGGAIFCSYDASPTLVNCILWSDTPEEIHVSSGSPVVTYSAVQGGWAGVGNIDADPLFVDPDGPDDDPATWQDNDYRLSPGSPCSDAGDPDFQTAPGDVDLDGHLRIWDGDDDGNARVDMGAYEFGASGFGDLNCDGLVNSFDVDPFVLALTSAGDDPPFAGYLLANPGCNPVLADINADGLLNSFDIDPFVQLLTDGGRQR